MFVQTFSRSILRPLFTGLALSALVACSGDPESGQELTGTPGSVESAADEAPLGRLPKTVEPLHYDLRLRIDPDRDSFSGTSRIQVRLHESGDTVWLHGKDLVVESVRAELENGEEVTGRYDQVADIGVARLQFPSPLPAQDLTLNIEYSAPFNTSLEGLYKVSAGGQDYAFTQFEATSARLAFPGFDEPAFKVPFDIQVETREDYAAVSTTPIAEETPLDGGFKLLRYQRTKPLPTYLIAFAVGPLDEVEGEPIPATNLRENPIPFSAYAVKGKGPQLRYALENTADIVIALEEYFGQAYPYEKLALIAVPDFGAGAMENVGAITYREQRLLVDEDSPLAVRENFFLTHTHELAHQWFGNLVTPNWWTDIWLNEAFATWMATKVMHQLQPGAGYAQQMLDNALSTMDIDRLVNARQIRQPVEKHADIGAAFDGITYQKGGAVLSMLEGFVGEEAFKQGIQNYMVTHRHGIADARDFVRAIATARTDLPEGQIEAAFFSFLEQPGTPLVDLDWECEEEGGASVAVRQSRYLPLGSEGSPETSWVLPLCVAYGQGDARAEHCQVIDQPEASFDLPGACPSYIMPNANASGYYRFALSQDNWEKLLNAEGLSAREQLAAANSLSGAFHNGAINAGQYLDMLAAVARVDDAQVVNAPLPDLYLMNQYMLSESEQAAFAERVAGLYANALEKVQLGEELETLDQVRLRTTLYRLFAMLVEEPAVRQQLTGMALEYTGFESEAGPATDALESNLREVALTAAVRQEGREFARHLLALFHDSDDAVLREELLRAAANSSDAQFRAELRELALSPDIRDNEVEHILAPMMNRKESREETWTWLRSNLDAIIERQPSWFQGRVIEYAAGFCDLETGRTIEAEMGDRIASLQRGPRSLATTLERIELCAALVEEQAPGLRAALQ
ncbi:M1 family metallopeptidase [Gilvimarinus sp. F26214L]|uniref:M1 family metallopeptidase n=1 Tax=Gilvimarinus sp. DZF01 TaxID=3461371 RepID=UPI0040456E34